MVAPCSCLSSATGGRANCCCCGCCGCCCCCCGFGGRGGSARLSDSDVDRGMQKPFFTLPRRVFFSLSLSLFLGLFFFLLVYLCRRIAIGITSRLSELFALDYPVGFLLKCTTRGVAPRRYHHSRVRKVSLVLVQKLVAASCAKRRIHMLTHARSTPHVNT